MKTLSTNPPKGTRDWTPDEFAIRKYIFDTWRSACESYGYEEYLTPIVESADLYRAKSGEDVGGKELMTMIDQRGRELALRPEMTPSVTRLISSIYQSTPKPIRYFSIANFIRNEKPQRGRNREFWQLNFDIFGSDSLYADVEILEIGIKIMQKFGASSEQFMVYINNRKLINYFLQTICGLDDNQTISAVRILDKWTKLSKEDFTKRMEEIGTSNDAIDSIRTFMDCKTIDELEKAIPSIVQSEGFRESKELIQALEEKDLSPYVEFQPFLMRGFDYYDGMVFEVFDKHPDNNRAMFGGGRYNGLASIFGSEPFPAVGCAPGDETTKLFLEAWNLLPENTTPEYMYVPLLDISLKQQTNQIAHQLRKEGKNVVQGFEVERIGKALKFADSKKIDYVVLYGENEHKDGKYILKNMKSGEEQVVFADITTY